MATQPPTTAPRGRKAKPAPASGEQPTPEPTAINPHTALLGSSVLPAVVEVGGGEVQLGVVVRAAFHASGLGEDAWNALPEAEREAKLIVALDELRAAASPANDPVPEAPAAPVAVRMLIGMEGPETSRKRGDVLTIGEDCDAGEAQRLLDADFAEPA